MLGKPLIFRCLCPPSSDWYLVERESWIVKIGCSCSKVRKCWIFPRGDETVKECSNIRGVNCTVCRSYGDIWTINMYIYIYLHLQWRNQDGATWACVHLHVSCPLYCRALLWYYWFKYTLERCTTHHKLDSTGLWTPHLQIITVYSDDTWHMTHDTWHDAWLMPEPNTTSSHFSPVLSLLGTNFPMTLFQLKIWMCSNRTLKPLFMSWPGPSNHCPAPTFILHCY